MKRARPKNKKAAMKRLKEQELLTQSQNIDDVAAEVDNEAEIIDRYEQQNDEYRQETHKEEVYRKERGNVKKSKKKRDLNKLSKVLLGILVGLIVFMFVVMGFGLFDESEILAPLENGKINVLLLGVDEEGLRTDAIMVASYDVNAAQVNMLSIPRDTKIYISNRKATRKINEIHAMSSKNEKGEILGAEATAEVVTQLTGIPINYYAEFSFSAIDRIFDILGPVEFDVPDVEGGGRGMNYDDPAQNLSIHLKPGLQKLSGNQVQQFLRYRKSNSGRGDGSDTSRVERQQKFITAVVEQKVNAAILVKLPGLFKQISKEIVTNISVGDITKYIRYVNKLTGESVHTHSLPGENKTISGGSYFVCNLAETKALMQNTFGITAEATDKITLSDEHSQKILRAGNSTKKKATPAPQKDESEKETSKPAKTPKATKEPTKEPTKAPVVTKTPTKAPVVTKSPSATPEATKTPLEDLDDDYQEIE